MIISASVRQGRKGPSVAKWFQAIAEANTGFEIEFVDLADLDLPLMTEPNQPRQQKYTQDVTKAWAQRVEAAHAFVFVMPEYNHSYTAPLKNALDYLSLEWSGKPVGFVTYGGVSGGTRAQAALQPVILALGMRFTQPGVNIAFFSQHLTEDGFQPNDIADTAAKTLATRLEAAVSS